MKIERVEALRLRQPEFSPVDSWCTGPTDALFERGQRMREAAFGLFNAPIRERRADVFMVIVRVWDADGRHGLGCIGLGSEAAARLVEDQLAPLIVGEPVFDTERLWETMYRCTVNIGRKGLVVEAISAIDIALWDLMGKALGQPCFNLLGGRTRERIRCYASAGYPMHDLQAFGDRIRSVMSRGFTAFKMRLGYGPADGRAGMHKNVELVRTAREAVGAEADLMADAYMGWDVPYAVAMLRMLEPYDLFWLEEPVLPDNIAGYAEVRNRTGTPIAGGEHEFTRWGFQQLIAARAVDYVQLDVNRVGGITEARKIWALAQAHSLPVVPHSQNFHNLHLIMANLNSPLSEYFPLDVRDGDTFFCELFDGEPRAQDGHLTLSDRPGLGVELNEAAMREFLLPAPAR
jgi:L-alanine-DL-glutamate epimerase-like enolase superfamily enzyme